MRAWMAGASMVLLVGCTGQESACTDIGAPSGVSITVGADLAGKVTKLTLETCWSGDSCREVEVDLLPGSDTVDQGCEGPDPEDACSATAVPNGTSVGFAEISDLPAGALTITASILSSGAAMSLGPVTVSAAAAYPNGRTCPAGGNQAAVTLDAEGLHAA